MGTYTDMLIRQSAHQIVEMIAGEYVELSHDKIKSQRDDFQRICRIWLEHNGSNRSLEDSVRDALICLKNGARVWDAMDLLENALNNKE